VDQEERDREKMTESNHFWELLIRLNREFHRRTMKRIAEELSSRWVGDKDKGQLTILKALVGQLGEMSELDILLARFMSGFENRLEVIESSIKKLAEKADLNEIKNEINQVKEKYGETWDFFTKYMDRLKEELEASEHIEGERL